MKDKVLLDIDGVIANFYAGFAKHLNINLGTSLDLLSDPSAYSLHKWGHNLPNAQIDTEIPKWIMQGGYKSMPIYPGAKKFVSTLMNKYDVYIVTARIGDFRMNLSEKVTNTIKIDTLKWFKKHGISSNKLIFEHEKINFCKNNNISIIIEDKLSTVVDGAKENIKAILINRGWNQNGEAWYGEYLHRNHNNIFATYGYDDTLNVLESIINGA